MRSIVIPERNKPTPHYPLSSIFFRIRSTVSQVRVVTALAYFFSSSAITFGVRGWPMVIAVQITPSGISFLSFRKVTIK